MPTVRAQGEPGEAQVASHEEDPGGDAVNIDYMVCYRVAGQWRIVSNTFVIRDADP